jgi:hypothetical protein
VSLSPEHLDQLRETVARSREAQGLPPVVSDPAAIRRVVDALTLAGTGVEVAH